MSTNFPFLQDITDPEANRNPVLQALIRSYQDSSLKASVDPYKQVDDELQGISPGRKFLANLVRGFASGATNSPFQSLQESLVEREINKQKIAKGQQDSQLLRIQQLMGQQTSTQNTGIRADASMANTRVQALVRTYGIDVNAATQLRNGEQRDQQFEKTLELKRDQFTETQNFNEWRKEHAEKELKLAERRVASAEKRNDLLGRSDGSYQAQSPEGQALQEIAKIGNSGETKTKGQADQLMTEMSYIAEMIDTAETSEVRAKWESAGRSKVLSLAANGLSGQAQKDAFQFRLKTLDVINTAGTMMNKLGPDSTGFFKGKVENWLRRYNGSASQDDVTKLFRVLNGHFFEYRQEMSGAAFGDKESAAYESISPTTDKEFNVNVALMQELERESIQELMNQLNLLGPQALSMFIKDVNGDKRFIYNGREYRLPK